MCEFCDGIRSECDMDDAEDTSLLCDCGHLDIDHEYLTLREIEALKAGDIECGPCLCGALRKGTTSDGELLT